MAKLEDLKNVIGNCFGRLTIIEDAGRMNNKRKVKAKCVCGKVKIIDWSSIKYGLTTSCGCYSREQVIKNHTTHGLSKHPLNGIWFSIKSRCYNPKDPSYYNYGGRGVKMSIRWIDDFESFYKWCIAMGWKKGMDVDKDLKSSTGRGILYCPELCSIISRKDNLRIKSNNHFINYNGQTKCMSEWCETLKIKRRTLDERIKRGWSIERCLKQNIKAK